MEDLERNIVIFRTVLGLLRFGILFLAFGRGLGDRPETNAAYDFTPKLNRGIAIRDDGFPFPIIGIIGAKGRDQTVDICFIEDQGLGIL